MNRDRLTRLAALLDRVEAEKKEFNLECWSCGTTACACGWAAKDPQFNAEGFILERAEYSLGVQPRFGEYVCSACLTVSCWHGEFMCWDSYGADTVLKSVSELNSLRLEHPSAYSVDKIRRVCGSLA